MELTDVSTDVIAELAKTNKMAFSTEDLVLIKVLRQKRLRQLMNNHTASLEITVNVHESVLSRKLVLDE